MTADRTELGGEEPPERPAAEADDEPAGAAGSAASDTGGRSWRSWPVAVAGLVALLLVASLLAIVVVDRGPSAEDQVAEVAGRFVEAWSAERWDDLHGLAAAGDGVDVAASHSSVDSELAATSWSLRAGAPDIEGDSAAVAVEVEVDIAGFGPWSYDTTLVLVRNDEAEEGEPDWLVEWEPATIHPALAGGRTVRLVREWPDRAPILARDGTPLTGPAAPPLPALAAQVVGSVGPATPERAAELGGPWVEGEPAGTTGLQASFEEQLAGRPTGKVAVAQGEAVVEVLKTFPGEPGQAVTTTFDIGVQAAGEAVLGPRGQPAALVAIHVPTGEVRAVVNRPFAGFNRALLGRYPPGSTFKVVTTAALLARGTTPETPTTCPATTNVGGRRFSNAGGEELGDIPFATAFFRSCNTAFVQLATALPDDALVEATARFGFGEEWDIGVPVVGGSFPEPEGVIERAAAAIGQGRVTASPLQMAVVAASVAAGAYRPPRILAGAAVGPRPLPEGVTPVIQELMRAVVAQGTGTAAQLPGTPVAGKTGTAEFGTAQPPRTHAWFIGFRADLAVAVVVEDGGFGGEVAAPLAADFLARTTG